MFRSVDWILWGLLLISVALEIFGDVSLKWWAETNRWLGFAAGLVAYVIAIGIFAIMLRRGELAIMFALWVGFAMVGVTVAGWWMFNEHLGWPQLLGIGLTLAGVVLLNVR